MTLKVIIVGAGIAGLCAGIALRQAGHEIEIFEKSQFATEIGAALMITPNGARVLSRLGFSFSNAKAVKVDLWSVLRGDNLDSMARVDLSTAEDRFGAAVWAIHRVDLHNELWRLATGVAGAGRPIRINLASEVVDASIDGTVILGNKSKVTADLIIAADGLHSVLRKVVLEGKPSPPEPTGLSAFRFLIETDEIKQSRSLSETMMKKGPGLTVLADVDEVVKERHLVWYACRKSGEIQNFVGIHPDRHISGDNAEVVKASMLQEFAKFSPELLEIIKKSSHVKCWPLFSHRPLPSWFNGRVVLIGDAAHPMLPFGGQGSNSAMEDGGSLGYLFKGVNEADSVTERLKIFEKSRKDRASRLQVLSSVRVGREKEVEETLRKYADPPGSRVPTTMVERTIHDYSFDVFKKCDDILNTIA